MSEILLSEEIIFIVDTNKDLSSCYVDFGYFCIDNENYQINYKEDGDLNSVPCLIYPSKNYACNEKGEILSINDPDFSEEKYDFFAPMSMGISFSSLNQDELTSLKNKCKEYCLNNSLTIESFRLIKYKKYAEEILIDFT